ncbi:glucose 1-dehydrogenase [Sphingobium faniae]|nr:glucose 1-dehydrogenase [Sphingobium faniae]
MSERNKALIGRTAIVTGGNSGIGRAIAVTLAAAGAKVAIAGRNQETSGEVVAEIEAAGGQAVAFPYDAQIEDDANDLVSSVVARLGDPVICVANAGGTVDGTAPLAEMTTEMWRRTVALNLDAPFFLYRAVVRHLIAVGKPGSLIGISSVASIRGVPSLHYAAAKGGLNAMTMNLSVQLGSHGIRANAILPGLIETPALQAGLPEAARTKMVRRVPLGRIGAPDDIASLALYLASDASGFMTGQLITVDGGMVQT